MAKFEVGNKMGGRKPGSLNRSTEQAKLAIARLANQGLNNITEDFEKIRKENPIQLAGLFTFLANNVFNYKQRVIFSSSSPYGYVKIIENKV